MDLIINQFNNLDLNKKIENKIIYENKTLNYKVENSIIDIFKNLTIKKHTYPKKKNKWLNFIKSNNSKF